MFRLISGEIFREIQLDTPRRFRYAVSNRGRLVSFKDEIRKGNMLKGSFADGYQILTIKRSENKKTLNQSIFIHKVIADLFLAKTSEEQKHVLHLDYNRANNDVSNLSWATYQEKLEHHKKSPHVAEAKRKLVEHNRKSDGKKLSGTDVIRLKKMINDPNRKTRLRLIAKQFKISEMQLYRIKSGENWAHIKV